MNAICSNEKNINSSSLLNNYKPIEKKNFELCFYNFKKYILEDFSVEKLIKQSLNCEIEELDTRLLVWKIHLNVLPANSNLFEWIKQTKELRSYYKRKKKEFKKVKKFEDDPLRSGEKNSWNSIKHEKELKKIIDLDIIRTYQEYSLFHNKRIKQIMFDVLFIFAQINLEVSYKQGMNEIVAVLLMVIYPYYNENTQLYSHFSKNLTHDELIRSISSKETEEQKAFKVLPDELLKEIYIYLTDESELEADLFSLFTQFMKRGIKEIFFVPDIDLNLKVADNELIKKIELFHTKWNSYEFENIKKQKEEENLNKVLLKFPIHKRINKIFHDYLPILDREIYEYLMELNAEVSIFLQRWLRCLLIREFEFEKIILIWDAILAYDMEKITTKFNYKPSFVMLDYICTFLIHKSRNEVLNKDLNAIYERYLHSAYNGTIPELINSALLVKELLKGKEKQKIMLLSQSIKAKSVCSSRNDSDSNMSPFSLQPEIKVCNKMSTKSSNEYFDQDNEKELETALDGRISIKTNFSSKSDNCFLLNSQIKKLEHIYLKYKNYFSLKDSREILLILLQLKNKSKSK